MGCCEQKSQEQTIDTIFHSFPIRKLTIEEFLHHFDKDEGQIYLSENQFQEIVNTYLLTKNEDSVILNDYWFEFYNDFKYSEKLFYVKFCLSLFCCYDIKANSIDKDVEMLKQILNNYKMINNSIAVSEKEGSCNIMYFSKSELIKLICKYVELISSLTIHHFKYFWYDSELFEREKLIEWNSNFVENFVRKKFFESMEDTLDKKNYLDIDEFLNENLYKLRNDNEIRKDFSEFSLKFGGEKEFEFTPGGGKVTVYSSNTVS